MSRGLRGYVIVIISNFSLVNHLPTHDSNSNLQVKKSSRLGRKWIALPDCQVGRFTWLESAFDLFRMRCIGCANSVCT